MDAVVCPEWLNHCPVIPCYVSTNPIIRICLLYRTHSEYSPSPPFSPDLLLSSLPLRIPNGELHERSPGPPCTAIAKDVASVGQHAHNRAAAVGWRQRRRSWDRRHGHLTGAHGARSLATALTQCAWPRTTDERVAGASGAAACAGCGHLSCSLARATIGSYIARVLSFPTSHIPTSYSHSVGT